MTDDFAARIARIEAKHGNTQPPMPLPAMAGPAASSAAGAVSQRASKGAAGTGRRIALYAAILIGFPLVAVGGALSYTQMMLP